MRAARALGVGELGLAARSALRARKRTGAPPRTPEEEATVIMASLGLGRDSAEIIF